MLGFYDLIWFIFFCCVERDVDEFLDWYRRHGWKLDAEVGVAGKLLIFLKLG